MHIYPLKMLHVPQKGAISKGSESSEPTIIFQGICQFSGGKNVITKGFNLSQKMGTANFLTPKSFLTPNGTQRFLSKNRKESRLQICPLYFCGIKQSPQMVPSRFFQYWFPPGFGGFDSEPNLQPL